MNFQLLKPADPIWMSFVDDWSSDVYHLPGYSLVDARISASGAHAALVSGREGAMLIPLIFRDIDIAHNSVRELNDAASPYGYPGPILSLMDDGDRDAFLKEALPTLMEGLADAGIVSAFVRLHPFVGVQPAEVNGIGDTVHHGDTVLVDLTRSEEELWSETRKSHRYEINRARKQGQRAYPDTGWEHFNAFVDIYSETMRRVNATDAYSFGRDYFTGLKMALGKHLHLWVVEIDGQIAAAPLFTEYNGIVQYHLSGTRDDYLRIQPNKLLLHEVRSWAKARGNRVMHLGGGVGGKKDSLFSFKAGFSKQTCPFYSWRIITDTHAYWQLVRRKGINVEDPHGDGFFPMYRRPVV